MEDRLMKPGSQEVSQSSPQGQLGSIASIEQARSVQEVQGMMIMAKRFPRDEAAIETKIMAACRSKRLAEVARYIYPKGGTSVQGPSIRLAESVARLWGNILYGIQELSRSPGSSEMEAYAWDLESNTRRSMKFRVDHVRWTKKGSYDLADPRDIYEMNANMGARRVRACIQGIIPTEIFDLAEEECEKTLNANLEGKPEERIAAMLGKYQEIGVPKESIETRLGHKIEATTNQEIITLRKIFIAIRDGMGKKEDYFELDPLKDKSEEKFTALKEKIRAKQTQEAGEPGQGHQPPQGAPPSDPTPPPHGDDDAPPASEEFSPTEFTDQEHTTPTVPPSPPGIEPGKETSPPPPPPEPPKAAPAKKKNEPETIGPTVGPKIEVGKKPQDYWVPNTTDMVKCPTGGERPNKLTKTTYCDNTCKFRKRCFIFA